MPYNIIAGKEALDKTVASLKGRNINAIMTENKAQALDTLKSLIPAGASVMTGGSTTLTQIGLDDLLISGKHPWKNAKNEILIEKDPVRQYDLRKKSIFSDFFIGSVHAIAETGEMIFASATGSQLPAYAFSAPNVIWVAGAQKITPTLDEAIRRVREYVLPLEDKRMKSVYGPTSGSMVGKLLIIENEMPMLKRKLTLIIVREILGF